MALQFSFRHFFQPLALLRHRRQLRGARFWSPAEWETHQVQQLKPLLEHAARQVPWWRMRFAETGFSADDFRTLADLQRLPLLTREEVVQAGDALRSLDWRQRGAHPVTTGGTTGKRLLLWMDRAADVQEFCYYWKLWNESGYRLGQPLAEFSSTGFRDRLPEDFRFEHFTRRLLLNGNWQDPRRCQRQFAEIRRRGCRYLKGLPSQLQAFASFLKDSSLNLDLEAVFSQGEILDAATRQLLETVCSPRVVDSWGQMERGGAIASCGAGRLHAIPEYGIVEFLPLEDDLATPGCRRVRLAVSSLYNHAMPLFRYLTGDIAEVASDPPPCPCGRKTPVVERIIGRESRTIRTPDGRVLTSLFLVFEEISSIQAGKIVPEDNGSLSIHLVPEAEFKPADAERLCRYVRERAGPDMKISLVQHSSRDEMRQVAG